MYLKEFINKMDTTRDTVRFYLKLNLLTPARRGKNYWFTDQETEAFAEIKNLKELGFSLKEISSIKLLHDQSCGTKLQREKNLDLIKSKIEENALAISQLKQRQLELKQLEKALKQKTVH